MLFYYQTACFHYAITRFSTFNMAELVASLLNTTDNSIDLADRDALIDVIADYFTKRDKAEDDNDISG